MEVGGEAKWAVILLNDGDDDLRHVTVRRGRTLLDEPFDLAVGKGRRFTFTTTYKTEGKKTEEVTATGITSTGKSVRDEARATVEVTPIPPEPEVPLPPPVVEKPVVESGARMRREMTLQGAAFPGAAPPVVRPSRRTSWSGLVVVGLLAILLLSIGAVTVGWFLFRESTKACTPTAELVRHVSIADGTVIEPGGRIDKVWKVENTGTCTWGEGYYLVFYSGDRMQAPKQQVLPETAPDKTTNIGVTMFAPPAPGTYTAVFRLRSPTGDYFGPELSTTIVVE